MFAETLILYFICIDNKIEKITLRLRLQQLNRVYMHILMTGHYYGMTTLIVYLICTKLRICVFIKEFITKIRNSDLDETKFFNKLHFTFFTIHQLKRAIIVNSSEAII